MMNKILINLALGCGFLTVLLTDSSCNSCESWIRKNETNNHYAGLVIGKYLDSTIGGRNQPRVILISGTESPKKIYSILNGDIFEILEKGDYMYKDSGTLKRFLIKDGDTISYYPQCGDGNDVK